MDGARTQLERWSASALSCYERCGERFRRRYLEREHELGSVALHVGTGVHAAAALDNRAKLMAGTRARLPELVDAAVAAFDAALAKDGAADAARAGEGRDGAACGARSWGVHLSPALPVPLAAEQVIDAEIAGVRVRGVLDYVVPAADGAAVVRDLKTGRRPGAGAAARSAQLALYGFLWRAKSGAWPARVALDHLAAGSRPGVTWDWLAQEAALGPADYAAVWRRVERVRAAVAAGVFLAAAQHEPTCGPKWCGFWRDCPLVPPARRAAAEDDMP